MWNATSLDQDWTRVAVSISYADKHYTTVTSVSEEVDVYTAAILYSLGVASIQ